MKRSGFLNEKIKSYKAFANSSLIDVYGEENIETALHLEATSFSSYYIENKGEIPARFKLLKNNTRMSRMIHFDIEEAELSVG